MTVSCPSRCGQLFDCWKLMAEHVMDTHSGFSIEESKSVIDGRPRYLWRCDSPGCNGGGVVWQRTTMAAQRGWFAHQRRAHYFDGKDSAKSAQYDGDAP